MKNSRYGGGPAVVLLRLNGEEQRRLALDHLLQQLRVVLEPFRQFGQAAGELQQQLEPLRLAQCLEVIDNFRQRGGKCISTHQFQLTQFAPAGPFLTAVYLAAAGTEPRSAPLTIGTRTALPHSVQEPS